MQVDAAVFRIEAQLERSVQHYGIYVVRPGVVGRRRYQQFVGVIAFELYSQSVQAQAQIQYRRSMFGIIGRIGIVCACFDVDAQPEGILIRRKEYLYQ